MTRQVLTEATTTPQATATPVAGQPGRFLIQLIDSGWGSSGYYSPAVLEAAAKAKVFPSGLHMYLDHEHLDGSGLDLHGNRSVKDLAAVLESDAEWNGSALVATAAVFGPYREALSHMAESIGVSIRASADVQPGEAEGRQGLLITELVEGLSADFVTRAGRGGKILQVIESARRAEIGEATANDTRDALQAAITDAYGGEKQWAGVRDFDESTVWFWQSSPDSEALLQQSYTTDDQGGVALSGSPLEVRAKTVYVPVNATTSSAASEALKNVPGHPAGQSTTQEVPMPEIAESELRTLREAAGRVQTLESERDAARQRAEAAESERDTAVAERDQLRESEAARNREATVQRVLGEAVEAAAGVTLNEFERAGVAARAVTGSDGQVDESATRTAFDTALASIRESRGHGRPRGLGGEIRTSESTVDIDAELDQITEAAFGGSDSTVVKEA